MVMAGIYLHIPFCKQACHYCNFHFSTSARHRDTMVDALVRELELRTDYLRGATVSTIYFGGGTPSVLDTAEIERLLSTIYRRYPVVPAPEITLEANPDDLTRAKLDALAATRINRLSIGIQSFSEADLRFMNRAHDAAEAARCVRWAQAVGFDDLSIDLIYGSPTTSHAQWADNLARTAALGVPHVSSYCLTVEPDTALAHFVKKGKARPVDEEHAAAQFEALLAWAGREGYEHYEISNFARPGRYARHNTNYWRGVPYLGVGPSAHSFDGESRQWNVAHNANYTAALGEDRLPAEREALSDDDRYNEYVMTSLRTMWGSERARLTAFGATYLQHFETAIYPYLQNHHAERIDDHYRLTNSGKLLADRIASDLFR